MDMPGSQYHIRLVFVTSIAAIAAACLLMVAFYLEPPFPLAAPYLMPSILLVLIVVLTPMAILSLRGQFTLLHPVVYAGWSYFLPVFVVGSTSLVTGVSEPFYLPLIANLQRDLPNTLFIVALGFASLSLGFALPVGRKAGNFVAARIPRWNWPFDKLVGPSLLMILVGEAARFRALTLGSTGYQMAETASLTGNLMTSFAAFSNLAMFSLWFALFQIPKWHLKHFAVAALMLLLAGYWVLVSGSKGQMFWAAMLVFMALMMSRKKISWRTGIMMLVVPLTVLLVGFTYGMTFRTLKGNETVVSPGEYFDLALRTVGEMRDKGIVQNTGAAADLILLRLETTSQVAVIVSNYERLRPLEAGYGLDNNIWTYTWTAFIPRFIWPDKPLISDARAVAALYYDFPSNSFAITPMADLLRNYGLPGIALGMGLLGVGLAVIYYALYTTSVMSTWRAAAYYSFLIGISYESFYGTILPGFIRTAFVVGVFGWGLNLLVRIKIRPPFRHDAQKDPPHVMQKA